MMVIKVQKKIVYYQDRQHQIILQRKFKMIKRDFFN